jgi:hypothetical protein
VATNIAKQSDGTFSAQLNFVASCGSGEHCSWYVHYRLLGTSTWTNVPAAPHGPVAGPISNVSLSESATGLTAGAQYEYQVCGNWQPGQPFICVGPDGTTHTTTKFTTSPHVMVVMMENESISNIIGNSSLPYINNTLVPHYPVLQDAYAVGHPSLPNYLELLSGSTWGVTSDCAPGPGCEGSTNLAGQLDQAGIAWAGYMESMPSAGYAGGSTGGDDGYGDQLYAQHHNPFVYFPGLASELATHVKPLTNMISDLNGASPPSFVWTTPNMLDDGHDGPLSTMDNWLSQEIPAIQATTWYQEGGRIILTWDEGASSDTAGIAAGNGGHVPDILISQALYNAPDVTAPVDQAGILRSIEGLYGLPLLNDAANSAHGSLGAELSG